MFAPALQKRVQVVVSGNATAYNSAMAGALVKTNAFKVGVVAAMAAVVALSGVLAGAAVKSAASFQQAMSKVKAISGSTAKEFKALENEAKRLGKITKFSMVDIASGMEVLARAGLKPIDMIKTMSSVTALAASQNIELSESAGMVVGSLKGMGLAYSQANRVANLYAAGAASAYMNTTDLQEAFTVLMPFTRALGEEMETTVGLIGVLADANLRGTKATTAMRTGFIRLAAPSKSAEKWLDRLGVAAFDAAGEFVGISSVIHQLEGALDGLSAEDQLKAVGEIFGKRAAGNWLAVINQGGDALDMMIAKVSNTNAAFDQQATMIDNLRGSITIFASSMDAAFQALGEPVLGVLQSAFEYLTRMVNLLIDRIRAAAPYIQAFFETMYSYISSNREAIGFLIKQIANMAKVVVIIAGVALAFKMLMSPILWLTAAAFAFYAAWMSNLWGVQEKIESFGNVLGKIISAPIAFVLDITGENESADAVRGFFDRLSGKLIGLAGTFVLGKWLIGGLVSGGTLAGAALTLPTLAVAAHLAWSIFNFVSDLKTEGPGAAIMGAMPAAGGVIGAIIGAIIGGAPGAIIGYTLGTAAGYGLKVLVTGLMETDWSIHAKVVDVQVDYGTMLDRAGLINPSAVTMPLNPRWLPGGEFALGGVVPGTGMGDTVAAMLEPGEFVIPKWMMEIQEVKNMITGIWSRGKRMAAGGPVGFTAGTAGALAIESKLLAVLNSLEKFFKENSVGLEGQAWVEDNFAALKQLTESALITKDEFNSLVLGIQEDAAATAALVDTINEQADASLNAVDAVNGLANSATTAAQTLSSALGKVKGYLTQMPGLLGEVAGSLVDFVQSLQANDWAGMANAVGQIILSFMREALRKLQDQLASLNEQLAELQKIVDFYVGAMQTIASTVSSLASSFSALGTLGTMLSSVVNLIANSFAMLQLEGIDLVSAGLSALSGFIVSMAGSVNSLIQQSDAYTAMQTESSSVWKTIGDLLGEFMWPLVGAIRYLKAWLGIQTDAGDAMTEIGVPSMWKRDRRAYESAAPGTISGGGGVEIPAWAVALGESLGEAIKNILEGFGINSLETILDDIRAWATNVWQWIIGALPGYVNQITGFLQSMWGVLQSTYDWAVNLWNEAGGWSGIMAIWEKFQSTMLTLPSWSDVQAEMSRLLAAIAGVEAAIAGVEAAIKAMTIIIAIVSAILAIIQALGLLGGESGIMSGILEAVMAISPEIALVVIAIIAVIAAIVLFGDEIIAFLGSLVDIVVGAITDLFDSLIGGIVDIIGAVANLAGTILGGIADIASIVVTGISNIAVAIINGIASVVGSIVTALGSILGGVVSAIGSLVGGIASAIGGIAHVIGSMIGALGSLFASSLNAIAAALRNHIVNVHVTCNCTSSSGGSGGGSGSGSGGGSGGGGGGWGFGGLGALGALWHWFTGFAEGGLITKPTLGLIGEGKNAEGVFPLSADTFKRFSVGIVDAMANMTGGIALTPSLAGYGSMGRGEAPITVYNEISVYLGEEEVSDIVVNDIRSRSRDLTGSRSTLASVNRRR